MERVFLDMDGVVVDFYDALCNRLNIINPYHYVGVHGIYDVFNMLADVDIAEDYAFWRDIPPTPDALEMFEFAKSLGEVTFLTHPYQYGAGSMLGKVHWRDKYFPKTDMYLAVDGDKSCAAHKGAWLIDDFQHNVIAFRERGGKGVLVPRPWNALHKYSWRDTDTFKCLQKTVDMYRSGYL